MVYHRKSTGSQQWLQKNQFNITLKYSHMGHTMSKTWGPQSVRVIIIFKKSPNIVKTILLEKRNSFVIATGDKNITRTATE